MPPVTLRNKQLYDTLYLAQGLITLSMAIIVWLTFTQNHFLVLALPLLAWGLIRNYKTIQYNKKFNIVMNAECEWRLVNAGDSKVSEAVLKSHWKAPNFILMHLRSGSKSYHPLILRKSTEFSAFSHLLQGVQKVTPK